METEMKTKKTTSKESTKSKATPTPKAVSADDVAKMTKWNTKHPELKFSWVVIADNTPTAQKSCRVCKKEFRNGRVTRLTDKGTYCGSRCQLKSVK
jgi:hypothetical protein